MFTYHTVIRKFAILVDSSSNVENTDKDSWVKILNVTQ
jgi:hypothetical protein